MTAEERIHTCLLLEQMEKNREYSKKLGLKNASTFHGEFIHQAESDGIQKSQSAASRSIPQPVPGSTD